MHRGRHNERHWSNAELVLDDFKTVVLPYFQELRELYDMPDMPGMYIIDKFRGEL